ncbi:Peroxidase mlt-7 [Trichinella nativa]|uniref:Peroxidase mlt-7 n=1 Tax=Trichinella nativa TaxID=6335 RepID=A0A0V1LGF2_9BILA|nr:Peroxidase mlt-7 [Trichinella nativa]
MILDNIYVGYKIAAAAATSLTFSVEILRNIGISKMHDFHIQAIAFCLLGSFIGLLSHAADPITKNFRCISANCCDQHEWCGFWAGIGECETNEKWMIGNCQISCKKCDDVNSTTAAPVTESVDVPTSDKGNSTLPRLKLRRGNDPLFCADMLRLNGSERFQEMVRNEAIVVFEDMMMNNQMMGCFREQESGDCSRNLCFHAMYRTLDGTCNNLRSPLVGAAGTAFNPIRLGSRPSAREATRFLLSSPQLVTSGKWNMLLMQFGQFIVHDISKTSLLPADRCGSCTDIPGRCFPIKVETVDPRFGCVRPPCCLFFTRSSPLCGTGAQSKREQVNENTAFLDGSAIYSSSLPDSLRLKDSKTGMMRITFFNNHVMPPFDPHTCFGPNNCNANFDIGDNRASIFIALVGVHAVFLREHNRIAQQLLNESILECGTCFPRDTENCRINYSSNYLQRIFAKTSWYKI